MKTVVLRLRTTKHTQMLDITHKVKEVVAESGVQNGICTIFIPHITAAVTINENADPHVVKDFMKTIDKIVPWHGGYHHQEGNFAAHLKASLVGYSEQIIIEHGELLLGTWQGLYFCEYDGPRSRNIYIKIMAE